jgi:SAM-dependent methyltransferase
MSNHAREGSSIEPPSPRLEDVSCPLGCGGGDTPLFSGTDALHGLPGTFTVVQCRTCGLRRTKPVRGGPLGAALRRLRLDGTRTLVPRAAPGRALEIGCASGGFLKKLEARGWRVSGVEPSAAAAEIARKLGLSVHVGPLETAPPPEEPLDLVTASHAFEHLHEPVAAFTKLRAWSKDSAWLTCAVPDSSTALFSLGQASWYDLDLPRHLFHFTPDTLTAALAKAGWRVVRVTRQATLNGIMGTVGNAMSARGWRRLGRTLSRFPDAPGVVRELLWPLAFMAGLTGRSGRMAVWARAR